jgi:uncharacterized protein (DUF1778 family)
MISKTRYGQERRAPGRPKKPSAEVLSQRLDVRLTEEERVLFEQAAEAAKMALSDWIRKRLWKVAKREIGK